MKKWIVIFLAVTSIVAAIAVDHDDGGGPTIELGSDASRVSIFVYHDNVLDHGDLIDCYRHEYAGVPPWQDERGDMAQDMGEVWMHQALLEHPWRVLDPSEADLFYIPMYPVLSYKLLGTDKRCNGKTHTGRMRDSTLFLEKSSPYFKRYGGADHVLICAWWNCRVALDPFVRMQLARVVIGINEKVTNWARWGCNGRMVTVPYTASSEVTTAERIGGRPPEERNIPFFFAGTSRGRPERENLVVVRDLFPDSTIDIGDRGRFWSENATEYADHITRSRYCFCPRGDSATSRRIFDAIAAGCIPVLTEVEAGVLPFIEGRGLNVSKFSIVAPKRTLKDQELLTALVQHLAAKSDVELEPMRGAMKKVTRSLIYGVASGPDISDMHPFREVPERFLQLAWTRFVGEESGEIGDGHVWTCTTPDYDEDQLAPKTGYEFPVPKRKRRRWLSESETIVNQEKKILFCAPPNTGSMQFRMLAKRMQGVEHWATYDDRAMLFDPAASGLNLLDVTDDDLMKEIYAENGSGWIKIAVVRDPVTRLLSAYLDLRRAREENTKMRNSNNATSNHDDENRVRKRRSLRQSERRGLAATGTAATTPTPSRREGDVADLATAMLAADDAESGLSTSGSDFVFDEDGEGDVLPFGEFVDRLGDVISKAGPAFQPLSSLCGLEYAPFDSIIPFETLEKTSTEVVKSLPGGVWDTYASSGWGPGSDGEFMEFDYGGANSWLSSDSEDPTLPARTEDLFAESSCEWTKFYTEESILNKVLEIYQSDYNLLRWYKVQWESRLQGCLA